MSELKRCPFCGGEASRWRLSERNKDGYTDSVFIRCNNCYASTKKIEFDASIHKNDSEYEEAEKAWNTRIPMQNIVERLEEYRDDFMNDIYEELREDADNCRANRIIDRFDEAIKIVK